MALRLTASRRTVIMPADLPTLQRSPMPRQRLSSMGRYGISTRQRMIHSLRLDVEGPDHLAPLFGFLDDEPAKVCGRDDKRRYSQVADHRRGRACDVRPVRHSGKFPNAHVAPLRAGRQCKPLWPKEMG